MHVSEHSMCVETFLGTKQAKWRYRRNFIQLDVGALVAICSNTPFYVSLSYFTYNFISILCHANASTTFIY